MSKLANMIAHQQTLLTTRNETARAASLAEDAYKAGSKALTEALVAICGKKVGEEIRTKDGTEGRILSFRQTDTAKLVAHCQGKTKAGKWSDRGRFLVAIEVNVEDD